MRICSGFGCLRAVPDGVRWCPECTAERVPPIEDEVREHKPFDASVRVTSDAIADRNSYANLYSSRRWQALRATVVREQPMCAICRLRLTQIVDHIVPAGVVVTQAVASKKFPFDGVAGFFWRPNLQGLCRSCHAIKTLCDKGRMGTMLKELEPRANTTLVCGLPGSGKTTFVHEALQPGDTYWDYDEVMQSLSGLPMHQEDPTLRTQITSMRDEFVNNTAVHGGRVFVIVMRADSQLGILLQRAGAKVITLTVPIGERLSRLAARDEVRSVWPSVFGKPVAMKKFAF